MLNTKYLNEFTVIGDVRFVRYIVSFTTIIFGYNIYLFDLLREVPLQRPIEHLGLCPMLSLTNFAEYLPQNANHPSPMN